MLNRVKLKSLLDQIREVIARFQEFIYILSFLSWIILFISIFEFGNESLGKSNLHTFDSCILDL